MHTKPSELPIVDGREEMTREPLEWGTNCLNAPDRGPHECNGKCGSSHKCLRCGCLCLCQWCNMGNPRCQSSVSDRWIHTDTPVGRITCLDEPATPKVAETQPAAGISKIFGTWPGDETDQELLGALNEIRKPETQPVSQELPTNERALTLEEWITEADAMQELAEKYIRECGILRAELAKLKSVDAESAERDLKERMQNAIALLNREFWDADEQIAEALAILAPAATLAGRGEQ